MDNDLKIIIGLHRVVNDIDRKVSAIVDKYSLTLGQFAVLEALLHKGNLSVGEVQKKILSSTGTIAVIVSNLVKLGYITKTADVKDKRRFILSLTPAGESLIKEVFPQVRDVLKSCVSTWEKDERATLLQLLKGYSK